MAVYTPLFVYLTPASIPQVVAHIQKYLSENPIISDPEAIAEVIQQYIEEHPEIIAVASVNGKTGTVVLTGSDININASSAVSVETQLLNLASMIQSASGDITQIEANISQIYTTIGTLQTNVETNASNISALQTSVEGQGTRLATAESDIDALESAQASHGTRLNTAEGDISSLQTRMTQAETDIDSNESNIETLQNLVNSNLVSITYEQFTSDDFTVQGNSSSVTSITFPAKPGYIPIGIVSYSFSGDQSAANYVMIGRAEIPRGETQQTKWFSVYNTTSSTRTGHISLYVSYLKLGA